MIKINHEHTVIGALLRRPSAIDEIELVVDDFEIESYRLIFQTIIDTLAANQIADVITVSSRLEKTHPGMTWLHFVGTAASDCPSTANIAGYAKLLKAESRNRKTKAICSDVLYEIDSVQESEQIIDRAVKQLMALSDTRQSYDSSISQTLKKSLEMISAAEENEGTVGIASGIAELDAVLGGFHDSDLYVIGARPAMGKTAFMLNLANYHNEQVGIISAEQPAEQLGIRLIAINGQVNVQRMRTGTMKEYDYTKLTSSVSRLHQNNNIWINDRSGIGIVELIRQARKWRHLHGIKALYVDYIQRIKWTDQKIAKWEQVGNVVGALKDLARDLDIPVIALAQVNRDVEKRADKRPNMGDLANSSEIEKEADVIMTLYRDEVYNAESADKGVMEVNVCKNRHGPIGYVQTVWNAPYMRVENFTPKMELVK